MSIPIKETDLSMALLGQHISVDLTSSMQTIPLSTIYTDRLPKLALHNRSGFGLIITLVMSSKRFNLPPNGRTNLFSISPKETSMDILVNYGAPLGPNTGNRVYGDLYGPNEYPIDISATSADSLSQPRVVSIPIVPVNINPNHGFFAAVPLNTPQLLLGPTFFSNFPNINLNNVINIYLYSLSMQIRNAGWAIVSITAGLFSGLGVHVPGFDQNVYGAIIDGGNLQGPQIVKYESPYPLHTLVIKDISGPQFGLFFNVFQAQNPGANDFFINGTVGIDTQNTSIPVDIGNLIRTAGGIVDPGTF